MPYICIPPAPPGELASVAEERWAAVLEVRPELLSAVNLQRRLLSLVIGLDELLSQRPLPRLSLPGRYLAAKLTRGVPALANEPIPLPVAVLTDTLLSLCRELAAGGAGESADHIRSALENGTLDAGSLLAASLSRDQAVIRRVATQRGFAPDLVWLVAELAVGPFVHLLQRALFADVAVRGTRSQSAEGPLAVALDEWTPGYCPACGSWPAMSEVAQGHRVLRCSFCAASWELKTYACVYCKRKVNPS